MEIGGSELNDSILKEEIESEKVVQIKCGLRHSLVLTDQGKIYGFGDNSNGQVDFDK